MQPCPRCTPVQTDRNRQPPHRSNELSTGEKKDPRLPYTGQIADLGTVRRELPHVTRLLLPALGLLLGSCLYQPEPNKQSADEDVYGILGETTKKLTGAERPFAVERTTSAKRSPTVDGWLRRKVQTRN